MKPKAIARFLKAYLALALPLAVIGYIAGVAQEDDLADASLQTELRLAERVGELALYRVCEGATSHIFLIDRKTILRNYQNEGLPSPPDAFTNPLAHKEFLVSFVGGASGTLTFASLMRAREKGREVDWRWNAIIVAMIALGGGYFPAFELGENYATRCNAPEKLKLLENRAWWQSAAKRYFAHLLSERAPDVPLLDGLRSDVDRWEQALDEQAGEKARSLKSLAAQLDQRLPHPLEVCNAPPFVQLKLAAERSADTEYDMKSPDFHVLRSFLIFNNRVQQSEIYERVRKEIASYASILRSRDSHATRRQLSCIETGCPELKARAANEDQEHINNIDCLCVALSTAMSELKNSK